MKTTVNRIGTCVLAGALFFVAAAEAQNSGVEKTLDITVQVLDGRSGKPLADQHVLVFTGWSSNAVKSHAGHTGLTTGKDGTGTLKIVPSETRWLQVFADGYTTCFTDPNQATFSVSQIVSKGLVTPNNCSKLRRGTSPGHFVVFVRPASFLEKMKW